MNDDMYREDIISLAKPVLDFNAEVLGEKY